MHDKKKLFLIDAMALTYRAYFAFIKNPRTSSKGINTGTILGFANSLLEVIKKKDPTHIIVAFDTPAPTFRKELYNDYKAHREAQPEDITQALPYIQLFLEAMGIPFIEKKGFEADDIIGTLARTYACDNTSVYMMTPDKDFAQLVNTHTHLYRPGIGAQPTSLWDLPKVLKEWGIKHTAQVTDILGLWGDASDNIPGVPGIGQKTAQKLIAEFGSIEQLLIHKHTLKGRLPQLLETYAAQALLSKKLAKICDSVPLDIDLEHSRYQGPHTQKLLHLCNELEFRQLPKRILALKKNNSHPQTLLIQEETLTPEPSTLNDIHTTPHHYHYIESRQACQKLIDKLAQQPAFAFDTETTGLDPLQARLLGISIAYTPHEAYYIDCTTPQAPDLLAMLRPLFGSTHITKIGQNLKYDMHILHQHNLHTTGPYFDTMIAHHLLEPEQMHNITSMAETLLAYKAIAIEELIGYKKDKKPQKCMSEVSIDQLCDYACEDADLTLRLYLLLKPQLISQKLLPLFEEVEMPLLPVLVHIERAGVALDHSVLQQLSITLRADMELLAEEVYRLGGCAFNIDSPKQLGELLFEKLKLVKKPKKTKTGQYTTSHATLSKLVGKHPIIEKVLAYRGLKKLLSTYVDALPELVSPHDDKVHTSYHQASVYTGRLSSTHPNLQNIPIRTAQGRAIRKAFVPSHPDYCLVGADYSQIELRLMAHCAQDTAMIEAFKLGVDIHASTAAKVFNTPLKDVTPTMRRQAKMVNFGIIYGISAFGLSQRLAIAPREAHAIIEAYFKKFSGIKTYMEATIQKAAEQGFVTTLGGRRRYFPHITSKNATLRAMYERTAINMPIQGSAAELIKRAMIAIHACLQQKKLPATLLMQVHDELLFEVHKAHVEEVVQVIKPLMQEALTLSVPLVVNIGIGQDWLAAH